MRISIVIFIALNSGVCVQQASSQEAIPGRVPISGTITIQTNCPGVVGDNSHDDTKAIQNCINNTPDLGMLIFRVGLKMKITSTLTIRQRYGLRISGETSFFDGGKENGPAFYWAGPDGGTMLDIENSTNVMLDGLTFFNAIDYQTGKAGADVAINVDENPKLSPITTDCIFERVALISKTRRTSFRGIVFADTSNSNVEHMTVRDSTIICSYGAQVGQGIVVGGSQNSFGHTFENNKNINNCATGIYMAGGGAVIRANGLNTNTTAIYSAGQYGNTVIADNDGENGTQFFVGSASALSDLIIIGNRIAAYTPPAGTGVINFSGGGGGVPVVERNNFQNISGSRIPVTGQGGYGAPYLISIANTYGMGLTRTLAGFYTFGYGLVSEHDTFDNVQSMFFKIPGTQSLLAPQLKLDMLDSAASDLKWVASENGAPYKRLLPFIQNSAPPCTATDIGNSWINDSSPTSVYRVCLKVSGAATWVIK